LFRSENVPARRARARVVARERRHRASSLSRPSRGDAARARARVVVVARACAATRDGA
jgi:hypothetical protein